MVENKEKRSIDRVLVIAESQGMNQSEFSRRMNVLPQDITNWKTRGMPPEHLERAATVLHCSVDELLGLSKYRGNGTPLEPWIVEYFELDEQQQTEIKEIVEDRIARFRRKRCRNDPGKVDHDTGDELSNTGILRILEPDFCIQDLQP